MRQLDPDDTRPPYLQVAEAIREAITTGEYEPGEPLPARWKLAAHFSVAQMTVQNAVRLLLGEGLVVARRGSGVFVRTDQTDTAAEDRDPLAVVNELRADVDTLRARVEELAALLRGGGSGPS